MIQILKGMGREEIRISNNISTARGKLNYVEINTSRRRYRTQSTAYIKDKKNTGGQFRDYYNRLKLYISHI